MNAIYLLDRNEREEFEVNYSFHRGTALARREILETVDSETLSRYRIAAARCRVLVQIVVKASEGQPFTDAGGDSQLVSPGCTLVAIIHPESNLDEFWQKVHEVTHESAGEG
jgi:hypothetical protein